MAGGRAEGAAAATWFMVTLRAGRGAWRASRGRGSDFGQHVRAGAGVEGAAAAVDAGLAVLAGKDRQCAAHAAQALLDDAAVALVEVAAFAQPAQQFLPARLLC